MNRRRRNRSGIRQMQLTVNKEAQNATGSLRLSGMVQGTMKVTVHSQQLERKNQHGHQPSKAPGKG